MQNSSFRIKFASSLLTGLLTLTGITAFQDSARADISAWQMFRHDPQHTGRSEFAGPRAGTLKWSVSTQFPQMSSPAIGSDGTIYIGAQDGKFYAVNPGGTVKWASTAIGRPIGSSPATGMDGTIYVSADKLYAYTPAGGIKWASPLGQGTTSSPAIWYDGTIYVGGNGLYAFNPGGSLKWRFETGDTGPSSPAIGADGTIYIGAHDKLYAVNPGGSLKWSFSTGANIWSSPAIGPDGTVYIGSWDKKLYAINADGGLKWTFTTSNRISSSPAIGSDGAIYIGSEDRIFYAIAADGNQKWTYNGTDEFTSSAAIGSDGTIYTGCNNCLYALSPDGNLKWNYPAGSRFSSPSISANGQLIVGLHDRLCSFEEATTLTININSPTVATIGNTYAVIPTVSGGTPPYTWSTLNKPSWLSLNANSGALTGTPGTTAKSSTFTLEAKDKNGLSAAKDLMILINPAPRLNINATTPTFASRGVTYILVASAKGGTAPYTWSMLNNPFWLSLDARTGILTGTPGISATTTTFSLQVNDKLGNTAVKDITINVLAP